MEIYIEKTPKKYLDKLEKSNPKIFMKISEGFENIKTFSGDIKKIGRNTWRYKIYHYRIIYTIDLAINRITIKEIGPRGDIYK